MIVAYIGDIGSGKTLSMVKQLYSRFRIGYDIYSNFNLNFSETKKTGKVNYLDSAWFKDYMKSGFDVQQSQIAIDECHVFFDSRNSQLKRNKIFSKFVTQSRKRTVDLYYTTQDKDPYFFLKSGQVELRLRKLTDYIVMCSCHKTRNKRILIVNEMYDKYGCIMNRKVFDGTPYINLYDTNEIIDFDTDY